MLVATYSPQWWVLVDWGGSLVEWSFMETQYNPVDGLATRSYVQMVSNWCYHCFHILGGEEDKKVAQQAGY